MRTLCKRFCSGKIEIERLDPTRSEQVFAVKSRLGS
jgi:hypothetical protein